MSINAATTSLNGGEISPLLYFRTELEKRQSSLALMENYLPLPHGGARKRPGTLFLHFFFDGQGHRLHSFRGSDWKRYILVFSTTHFFAWDIAAQNMHTQTIDWGLTADAIKYIRITALNDILLITSSYFAPVELRYTGPTAWAFRPIPYTAPPLLDENLIEHANIRVHSQSPAPVWVTATAYAAGIVRMSPDGTTEIISILAHTSAATTEPLIGATWRTAWEIYRHPAGTTVHLKGPATPAWASATAYKAGQYVSRLALNWRCLIPHTSSGATTPGAETLLGTFWALAPPIFQSTHVAAHSTWHPAARFRIRSKRDDISFQHELRAITSNNNKTSTPIIVSGDWDISTYGTWHGTFTIQRSTDNGITWLPLRNYESAGDRNVADSGFEEVSVLLRLHFTSTGSTAGGGQQRAVLSPRSSYIDADYIITEYITPHEAIATVASVTLSGPTSKWSEGAFSRHQGYPSSIALYERRLWFAATSRRPLSIWSSHTEDFYNFTTGTADTDAIFATLAASSRQPILWLAAHKKLIIGTLSSEWIVGTPDETDPITPSNFLAREVSQFGSHPWPPPIPIGDSIIFPERDGLRLREFTYTLDAQEFGAPDLTRLATHLFDPIPGTPSDIRSLTWQTSREPTLWTIRAHGACYAFTYIRAEKVFAWTRITTRGGTFKDVCAARSDSGSDDIFFIVNRDGVTVLEVMPTSAAYANTGPYLDGQQTRIITGNRTPQPIGTPAELTIYINPDSHLTEAPIIQYGVNVTLPASGLTLHSGIAVHAHLITLPYEVETATGSSIGRKKRIHKARACALASRDLECLQSIGGTFTPMKSAEGETPFLHTPPSPTMLKDGFLEASVNLSSLTPSIHLRHITPSPSTITTIIGEFEVYQP